MLHVVVVTLHTVVLPPHAMDNGRGQSGQIRDVGMSMNGVQITAGTGVRHVVHGGGHGVRAGQHVVPSVLHHRAAGLGGFHPLPLQKRHDRAG